MGKQSAGGIEGLELVKNVPLFRRTPGYRPPKKVDLRNFILEKAQPPVPIPASYKTDISAIPVFHQHYIPDCVENAVVFAKKYYDYKQTGSFLDLCRRFLAIETVKADGFPLSDGTNLLNALKNLKNMGVCESHLLSDDHTLDEQTFAAAVPTPDTLQNAKNNVISTYAFLSDLSIQGLKNAIYQNGIVIVGAEIDKNWWTNTLGASSWLSKDILPLRPAKDRYSMSGHAFVLYGYDDQYIYLVNSFGPTWGDAGLGYYSIKNPIKIYEAATVVDFTPEQIQQAKPAVQIVETIDSLQKVETPQNVAIIQAIIASLWGKFLALFSPQSALGSEAVEGYAGSMSSGEVAAIVTLISTIFAFLGVSGVDTGLISQAVTGVISIVGVGAAVWSWWIHRQNKQTTA